MGYLIAETHSAAGVSNIKRHAVSIQFVKEGEPLEIGGTRYVPERTGTIETVKEGPCATVYRHTCCGWEYTEYDSDRFDMPEDFCPKCGARLE